MKLTPLIQAIGNGTQEAPNGATIMDYRYTYDAAGNITQRTTEAGDYLYSYDNLDQLTGATPPPTVQRTAGNPDGLPVERYTYDSVHNRKTSAHQPGEWTYNADNELEAWGAGQDQRAYQYDANGNTIEQKTGNPQSPSATRNYAYNAAERLSEVKDNGVVIVRYKYDPMGRRFRTQTQHGIKWYQYANGGLIAEYAEDGTLTRAYGWKPGGIWRTTPVWLADIVGTSWTVNLYHNDRLGTSQRLSDTHGALTWKMVSDAFGRTDVVINTTDNPLRFPGQYFDAESTL